VDSAELDPGQVIRFEHFFDDVKGKVAEGKIVEVYWTSVGYAYKVDIRDSYIENESRDSSLFVTPSQVIAVIDHQTVYTGENWRLMKKDDQYFLDILNAKPVQVEVSELERAAAAATGDTE
jgi:hypothetical protein